MERIKCAGATRTALLGIGLALIAGCSSKQNRPLTIGATPSTERIILAEVAAQHLEKQLNVPVERRTDLGSAPIAYEALVLSTIDIYPEDTNVIMVSVMKDNLDPNPDNVLLRVQNEMPRLGRIQVLNPVGIQRRPCIVVRANDARDGKIGTLSDAARSRLAWTLGVTSEFQQRSDAFSALMSAYNIPLKVAPKPYLPPALYPALADNQVSMVGGYNTDGPLSGTEFVELKDDKAAFRDARTCYLIRQGLVDTQPQAKVALAQLSGKFNNETIRKLNYEVDVMHRSVKDVAASFLRQAGL